MRSLILVVLWCTAAELICQNDADNVFASQLAPCLQDLETFVGMPNSGLDRKAIDRNLAWLSNQFSDRGFEVKLLSTKGNPLLFAQKVVDAAKPTLLFYMHVDGQPADATKWDQADPYQAVLKERSAAGEWQEVKPTKEQKLNRDWRLFGRSAADDKGPIVAFLHAYRLLQNSGADIPNNIKVIIDAEEEIGSQSLADAVKHHRDAMSADLLIINDGPVHLSGQPTLIFGCRGIMRLDLTAYGPIVPQHSGHYGNYAPNPIFRLATLLASMKDEQGRVLIKDYYEGINLDTNEQALLARVPDDEPAILNLLQIAAPERVGDNYQESLQYPSLNIRGIAAGWVGAQARTIVPDKATAALDIRLVPESEPEILIQKIRKHIEGQGFFIVDHEPTLEERKKYDKILYLYAGPATVPFRTDQNSHAGVWLVNILEKAYQRQPIQIRMMGGTVPITDMIGVLDIPAIIIPMVNADNNQHSPNENMRLGHLENAMKTFYHIFLGEGFASDQ